VLCRVFPSSEKEAVVFGPLSLCNNGTDARWQRWKSVLWNPISMFLLNTRVTVLKKFPISRPILLHRRSEKCIVEGSKYAHWIRLYLSFHLSWILDLFVHGRLQNLKASEDTFGHDITPLNVPYKTWATNLSLYRRNHQVCSIHA